MNHLTGMPCFLLNDTRLTIPPELRERVHSRIILAPCNGNLWLFTLPFWKKVIDKLAAAEPSEERTALLGMIATALEVEIVAGKAQLPEAITTQLAQGEEVILDGKTVGFLERQPAD